MDDSREQRKLSPRCYQLRSKNAPTSQNRWHLPPPFSRFPNFPLKDEKSRKMRKKRENWRAKGGKRWKRRNRIEAIFLRSLVCGRCNECWPISRLFSRTMRSFRANEGLGGGWSGEPRGKGLVHGGPVARSRGNSTESWAKAKGSAAAGDSGGTHAAAPIVLRFWEAEALPISERSGAISGHEVRPCFWQTVITQSTTHPRRTTVLLAVAVIQFTVITHGLAFRYATLATRPPD